MAKEVDKQTIIDNHFFVPPGVIDVRQGGSESGTDSYIPGTTAVAEPILETPESLVPMPPTSYTVVDQRVRIASDGRTVVDVVLEFADVPGVNSIDVRVSKL